MNIVAKLSMATLVLTTASVAGLFPALSQTIKFGSTMNSAPAPAFVAADKGLFKKHGLDVEMTFISIDPTSPPALVSNSIQIGSMTPSIFLQAVDKGLDLVAIAGATVIDAKSTSFGIVAREGIQAPADLIGKTIGVPGIGSVLHVMAREWLQNRGVDPTKVKFVEAMFPTHVDLLKSGRVDAVVSAYPFLARAVSIAGGRVIGMQPKDFPSGKPVNVAVATRAWAEANRDKVAAYQAAIRDAAKFSIENPQEYRAIMGRTLKQPAEAIAGLDLPVIDPAITAEQLNWWIDVLNRQNMLTSKVDTAKLIFR